MDAWISFLDKFLDNINLGKFISEFIPGSIIVFAMICLGYNYEILQNSFLTKSIFEKTILFYEDNFLVMILITMVISTLNSQVSGVLFYNIIFYLVDNLFEKPEAHARSFLSYKKNKDDGFKSEIYYLVKSPEHIPYHISLIQNYYRYVEVSINLAIPILLWTAVIICLKISILIKCIMDIILVGMFLLIILNGYLTYNAFWFKKCEFIEALKERKSEKRKRAIK